MRKLVALVVLGAAFASLAISDVDPPKDSEFVFARVQFNMGLQWYASFDEEPWHHDFPFSEDFVLSILKEVTSVHTTEESYKIVQLADPEIVKFPFLYFSEPGFMQLTPKETTNLREWFNRGGFAVFDDFRMRDMDNLRKQMKLVFPNRDFVRLGAEHPIFNTFYAIDSIEMDPPYYQGQMVPEFWGLNDDEGRLIAIANHNNDFGEFFEWVDKGEMPFQPAAKATRLMVNYLIYGMTH
jgi:hypothetical protein